MTAVTNRSAAFAQLIDDVTDLVVGEPIAVTGRR